MIIQDQTVIDFFKDRISQYHPIGRIVQSAEKVYRRVKQIIIERLRRGQGLFWYAASKHAVEGMTYALRLEVKPFGINVILIEPGWINTGFEEVAVNTLKNSDDPECYDELNANFEKVVRNGYEGGAGPEVVAEAVLKTIESDNPKARYTVGPQSALSIRMKRLTPDGLMDIITERMYG